jgi:uncharacterized protein YbaR (Trm112 family)
MTLAKELLEILACPKCKGKLEYREGENKLLCGTCRLAYGIQNDIPVLLVEQGTVF